MNNKNKKLKVTFIDKLKLYSDIQRLKFKKIKRDYNEINKDYNNNSERWNRNLDEINFETWKGNYNVDGSVIRILSMNKKLIKGTWDDYAEKYTQQIIDSLIKYKTESVVELGSGLGFLLFKLNQNNFKKLEGFDLSENAISVLKKYEQII